MSTQPARGRRRAAARARGDGPARGRHGEPLTPLELGAWRGFLQAHAQLTRELDGELQRQHGLSLSAYEVLMLLADAEGGRMRISELSSATLLSMSGVSRLVDRLVRAGLAKREACEEDGRGARVALTPMGRGRVRAARATHLAGVRAAFLERFSDAELEALGGGWLRLRGEAAGPPA